MKLDYKTVYRKSVARWWWWWW